MKKLLILLLAIPFLSTQAQDTIDSSRVAYFRKANTVYREVSAFPVGAVADSIDYFETGGVKFQRLDSRSTVYDLQALRIYANGSNMRALLQRVLNNTRITGIKLDQFGGGVIDVTGATVDFNGKRLISYGGTILKADSVANVAVYAPADVQVFDSTTKAGNIVSGIFSVSPKWFGAKGTGINDDTKAIQRAFNIANVNVRFPIGTYYATDSLTLNYSNSIEMPSGSLIISTSGIIIGSYNDANQVSMRGKTYSVRIKRATQSDWVDTLSVGVKFVNINHSKVTDIDAAQYTIGMKTIGYNAGITGMEYRLGFFERNMVDIWVTTANPGGLAWNNENKYYGGYLRNGSENSGKQTFGVWLGGGGYSVTNNIFLYQSIEKRSNAIPFLLIQASRNHGEWFRSEGNSDTTVKILANGTSNNDNDFYAGRDGGVGKIYDYSAYRRNYYNSADRIGTNKSDFTTITEAPNLGDMASYSGSDSSVSIAWPLLFLMRDSAYPRNTAIGPVIGDGAIIFRGSVRGAVVTDFIDVSKIKKIAVKVNITDTTTSSTFLIKMYDKYGHLLGNDVEAGTGLTMSYSTSFGGSWLGTFTAFDQFPVSFPDTVKKVIIGFGKTQASGNAGIKDLKIVSGEAGSSSVATVYNNRGAGNTSPTIPTIGSYMLGQQIMNSNPKKDSAYGWVCTSSGTFGPALTGVKATYANNSNVVILNSGSGTKVSVGEWLQIGANPTKILGISGDTLFLGNRTFGTLSDGDISYAVPTFEIITKIAQTGGAGSGEANTASNYGVGGVGVYDSKNGVDLRLRNINAGSNKISVALDNTNHEVDIDVNPANLTNIPQSGVTGLTPALDSLRKNDTLHYDIYRGVGGSKEDSLYVEFQDTVLTVYSPINGGKIKIINDANYTVEPYVYSVLISNSTASRTITLPDPTSYPNRVLILAYAGGASFTMNFNTTIKTNSSSTISNIGDGKRIMIQSDGTSWWLILTN